MTYFTGYTTTCGCTDVLYEVGCHVQSLFSLILNLDGSYDNSAFTLVLYLFKEK